MNEKHMLSSMKQPKLIWKVKENGSKTELFVHLNMNAAFANALAAVIQRNNTTPHTL